MTLGDPTAAEARLKAGDAVALTAQRDVQDLLVTVEMALSFAEGMYTVVGLQLDCDDNAKRGINGSELLVRAAVGSRFRPNAPSKEDAEAGPALEIRRGSYSIMDELEVVSTGKKYRTWIHTKALTPPVVEDRRMSFRIQRELIQRFGDRYHGRFRFRATVTTTCSEQPVPLDHTCEDEGLPIKLDGRDGDWTGEAEATDLTSELHKDARSLDITRLVLDHDEKRLFVGVGFTEAGLAEDYGKEGDVVRTDRVSVHVEPLRPAYGAPITVVVPAGVRKSTREDSAFVLEGHFLEVSVDRRSAQTRFRVVVWSDAERTDRVPDDGTVVMELPDE